MRRNEMLIVLLPVALLGALAVLAAYQLDEARGRVRALEDARANQCNLVEYRLAVAAAVASGWLNGDPPTDDARRRLREDLVSIAVQSAGCLEPLPPTTVRALHAMDLGQLDDALLAQGVLALDDALIRQAFVGWPLPPTP